MLYIRKFSKSYNDISALSIDHLNFSEGVHWIKGSNGSGKTTLFKSLAGLLPCEGDIYFDDQISLKKNPIEFRRRVNYSEAEPVYPGFLTAKDLIRFIGSTKKADTFQQEQLTMQFGINSFYEKSCETYSSGMLKKLSLALAFLGSPQVVILDEPLITLDEQARLALFQAIQESILRHHTTFLISSHQLIEHAALDIKATYHIQNKTIVTS